MDLTYWSEHFHIDDEYVIWGCSDFAEQFVYALGKKIQIKYFVDIDSNKQGKSFCNIPVYSPEVLTSVSDVKVIISNTYMGTRAKIAASLKDMGFVENSNFTYIELVFSIFSWQSERKIVSQYVEISTTTFCTLNCKNCTAYMPYVKKRRHLALEELEKSVDAYFECVDYVGRFRILGGEPFVYPDLVQFFTYIGDRYRSRIGELCIVTNGTVALSNDVLDMLKKYAGTLFISNYTESGHPLTTRARYHELTGILEKNNIPYHFSENTKWLELGNPVELRDDSDNIPSLTARFNDCRHYCRSLFNGHLFMCATWAFSVIGEIYSDDWKKHVGDEILDLKALAELDKKDIFAAWFRFDIEMDVDKKYLDFCKYCDGFGSHNQHFVKVGEQK